MKHEHKPSGWKNFFAVIGVIFVILFLWDLFSLSEEQNTSQSEILQNQNINVQDSIKQNIVWIKYEVSGKSADGSYFETGSTGSGVIVGNKSNELTVYTNRHVVDCQYNDIKCFQRISENIQVRTQDGKLHTVDRVLFSNSDIDLAILEIKDSNAASYSTAAYYTTDFKIGDKVIAVGYPSYTENVVEFSIKEGTITNIKEVLAQSSGKNFRTIESDAYTYFGSSGGGLFDTQGNLIGVNTWGATGQSIAIDFGSISKESFTYCKDSYFSDGACYNYCDRERVLGSDGICYGVCDNFYCESKTFNVNDPRCEEGLIPGDDGYCHQPCESSSTYCVGNYICYKNKCVSCPSTTTHLFKDGTCRKYQ